MSINAPDADDTTLRAKGTLKICDAPAGVLSETQGALNFIGNPYQAIVGIKTVLSNSTNLNSNFYQVWDPKVSTRGAYVAYTFDGNLSTNTSSDVNAYLQPWQACLVATTSSGASIMFHESDKKTDSQVAEGVYRTNNLASYIRLTLYESNTLAFNGAAADGLIVKFGNNYDNTIDGYDAIKLGNLDETFSTKNNTSLLLSFRLFFNRKEHKVLRKVRKEKLILNYKLYVMSFWKISDSLITESTNNQINDQPIKTFLEHFFVHSAKGIIVCSKCNQNSAKLTSRWLCFLCRLLGLGLVRQPNLKNNIAF